jgi:predicted  nucleic acid-binding Zn-ribbon protein
MSQVQLLYRLQQYDTEIAQKKRRLSEVLQLQRETAELLAARKRFATASDEVGGWTIRQTDLNLELGSVNEKAKRSENRLYSGQVTNPKELEDLHHEVEALGRRRGVIEDEVLEAMIMLEDAQAELNSAQDNLSEIETAWEQSQAALKTEQNELAIALHGLMAERETQKNRIDPAALKQYEAIRKRANGLAVVPFVNNACTGCHVTVSANKALQVERGERVTCNGCGRILVRPY